MTSYAKGRRAEYEAMEILRKAGWEVMRSAGSHGPFDIVAWDREYLRLIQVKSVRSQSGIADAKRAAMKRLENTILPEWMMSSVELWVRCRGRWHTYLWYGNEWASSGVEDVLAELQARQSDAEGESETSR